MAKSKNILQDAKKRKAEELLRAKRLPEARAAFEQLCRQSPRDYESWLNLGVISGRLGLLDAAEAAFKKALSLRGDEPHIYVNLARLSDMQGKLNEEIEYCRSYLRLRPEDAEARTQLGKLLQKLGRLPEAEQALREALRCSPDVAAYHYNVGVILCDLNRYDEALDYFQAALRLNPRMDEVHCNLGYLHHKRGEDGLAEASYAAAVEINPHNATALKHLGDYAVEAGCHAKALAYFERAVKLEPDRAELHWNIALLLLLEGNFKEGWREYEWRFRYDEIMPPEIAARYASKPLWDGSPLSGQTLLVYTEQGFGDALQFCRYLPIVRQRVERVIFECPSALYRLMSASFEGLELIESRGEGSLPDIGYDLQVPLLSLPSLPRLSETTIESVPRNVPYIHAPNHLVEQWRQRLHCNEFRIGLVWSGNPNFKANHKRSFSLEALAPLGSIQGICFFSLQKGPAAAEAQTPPAGMRLINLSPELDDFATTAAVIANLDLVITVDTSVAHLAGAMGRPVWVLIHSPFDWRWLLDRDDNPWYPTMRLFRQTVSGEWEPVIGRVAEELRLLLSSR